MADEPTASGRVTRESVAGHLRGRIVDGEPRPGERLPSQAELVRRFGCSPLTVQRAFDRLKAEGFIQPRGPEGTFVTPFPPHRYRVGLVFPTVPGKVGPYWSLFWEALLRQAREIEKRGPWRLPAFHDGPYLDHRGDDYGRLVEDLRHHTLAGLIFVTHPFRYTGTPVLDLKGVARVTITPTPVLPAAAAVYVDFPAFIDQAIACLAKRGRRRLALIATSLGEDVERFVTAAARAQRLEVPPYWRQAVNSTAPEMATRLVHLLFRPGQRQSPDGLVIMDDNLTTHAVAGLAAAGVRVPDDVEVVSHCNYPLTPDVDLPLTWLGYDAAEILRECIARIEERVNGNAAVPARACLVPPILRPPSARRG